MSVPAGIMQALQQAGAGGPGGAAGGPPPSIQIPGGADSDASSDASAGDGDAEQDLHDALDSLQSFLKDDSDHVDKAQVAKCVSIVQGILAARQKGSESALGVTPAHKAMSRAYGG